jgi:hypothetical protein
MRASRDPIVLFLQHGSVGNDLPALIDKPLCRDACNLAAAHADGPERILLQQDANLET